ncbi:TetR family transcriptional regulator [Idiomarina xiamenensis]|uniref:AcrAB operon repressor n=1 Tax=Idiomarina xiamenensis 10-D-4 TaxID=740709 RepID=K2K2K1_9GAMM|nr:TetR family transcriptional regulator [Idiomarina xiamenensis]EKE80912.1 AcrAB operon repressor [Idiomarina xiamenensis 10-D-4]
MVRRTKEDALETRSELLDAAERLFSEKGVTNTSMMQVAEAAGVTRGAIYHHFKNKLDLIESLMERVRLPVDEMRGCGEQVDDNPLHEIVCRSKQFIHQVENDPNTQALVSILFHKCEYIDDVLPIKVHHLRGRNECIEEVQQLFVKAIKQGRLPDSVDPRSAVLGLFGLIDGLMYNWLLDPSFFSLTGEANIAIKRYLTGLEQG